MKTLTPNQTTIIADLTAEFLKSNVAPRSNVGFASMILNENDIWTAKYNDIKLHNCAMLNQLQEVIDQNCLYLIDQCNQLGIKFNCYNHDLSNHEDQYIHETEWLNGAFQFRNPTSESDYYNFNVEFRIQKSLFTAPRGGKHIYKLTDTITYGAPYNPNPSDYTFDKLMSNEFFLSQISQLHNSIKNKLGRKK